MPKKITYKTSGVDIAKANTFVRGIQPFMKQTSVNNVLVTPAGFGGMFSLVGEKYTEPVLASSTDGVGTKLLIAQEAGKHDTVGIDLVAMNVNDILCVGAKPLFFLDYIACGKVKPTVLKSVVKGISRGCQISGCSLIGGETAEMPGMYKPEEYDLAGFTVGIVEKRKIIDGTGIRAGDKVIGLASSGLHSNGFSLVRKVFSKKELMANARELLTPTKIYVREVLALIEAVSVKGIAHITGGAFYEKLTKILPKGLGFSINKGSWPVPKIFKTIQTKGNVPEKDMFRTFNMGIGLAVVVAPTDVAAVQEFLSKEDVRSFEIGQVVENEKNKIHFV